MTKKIKISDFFEYGEFIGIHIKTDEEYNKFMNYCKSKGYKWMSDKEIDDYDPRTNKTSKAIYCDESSNDIIVGNNKYLMYCYYSQYLKIDDKFGIYEFDEVDFEEEQNDKED